MLIKLLKKMSLRINTINKQTSIQGVMFSGILIFCGALQNLPIHFNVSNGIYSTAQSITLYYGWALFLIIFSILIGIAIRLKSNYLALSQYILAFAIMFTCHPILLYSGGLSIKPDNSGLLFYGGFLLLLWCISLLISSYVIHERDQ